MKSKYLFGIVSTAFLIIGGILPIAKLNDEVISIFPVWNNFELHNGLWQWKDISFFSVTLIIIILFSFYLIITKKYKGFIVAGALSIFICLIIFVALLQINSKVNGIEGVSFTFSLGLFVTLLGGVSSIYCGLAGKLKP